MNWARKSFVGLLAVLLFFSLLGAVAAFGINNNLGNADKVEKLLVDSKVYDHVVSSALSKSQDQENQDQGQASDTVSLKDAAVQRAANEAFSPTLLKNTANSIIDANFAWLAGKTPTPQFNVDLTSAKQDFAKRVGDYVTAHLTALPPCTALQQAQLPAEPNVLTLSCRPAGIDPQAEGAKAAQEVSSGDFLSKPVITQVSLGRDDQSQKQPYYDKLSNLPKLYQLGQNLPWILAILAAASATGLILLTAQRRKGWRRVALILLEVGVILIVTALVADALTNKVEHKALNNSVGSQLNQPVKVTFNHLESNLSHNNLWFGIVFLVLAVIIFVLLRKIRPGIPSVDTQPDAPAVSDTGADAPTRLKKPGSKPKKPPRLIQ